MTDDPATELTSSQKQILQSEKPPAGSLIMSGMRTTSALHIGNYHGALKQWLELQKDYDGYYGAMNWHAMTSHYKTPHEMMNITREIIAEWLAWGLDPERNVIFVQSEVPEHIELFTFFFDDDTDVVGRACSDVEGC